MSCDCNKHPTDLTGLEDLDSDVRVDNKKAPRNVKDGLTGVE